MIESKLTRLEKILLFVWFVINLGVGALTVHEYGMSIDEPNNYRYASDTLDAYPSFFGTLYEPKYNSTYDGHGPAFVTIASIPIGVIQRVFPSVPAPDLWHFSYFVTFQLTGLCLYWLTKRWFSRWTAWGILVLFGTQPLLLGHSFINPKDIPFMFLITLSIALGFRLVDNVEAKESFVSLERPARNLAHKFQKTNPRRRKKFLISLAFALSITFAFTIFSRQINALIEQVVVFFYTSTPDSWAGQIFNSAASPSPNVSAEDYVTKAIRLFLRFERIILITGLLFFLSYFILLIMDTTIPTFLGNTWKQRQKLGIWFGYVRTSLRRSLNISSLRNWFAEFFRALRNPYVILAGVALGLATAVRAIAPLAGVIVFLYLIAKVRSKAWTTGIAYILIAGIVTYLAWPRLWDAVIPRYLEGLGVISNFPHSPGRVLFNGTLYGAGDLPLLYLPTLLTIQFTEPLILGAYIGLGILVWRILRSRLQTDLLLHIGLGFAFPLFGLMLLNTTLYHNFRQALFMIPPLFMLAAFTLELVFSRIARNWARVLLIAAIALPGVYSSIKLYPYEYVYYNSLVGGVAGVQNRFELDYWRISLREAALELNEIAPAGSIVVVTRSAGLFARYARPDLIVDKPIDSTLDLSSGYDYVVQVARWEPWEIHPDAKNVVVIERAGAVLATAKDVRSTSMK
jgi:4-amino-4-deoxy-L-arabinose transferase-like glycosyltransferase